MRCAVRSLRSLLRCVACCVACGGALCGAFGACGTEGVVLGLNPVATSVGGSFDATLDATPDAIVVTAPDAAPDAAGDAVGTTASADSASASAGDQCAPPCAVGQGCSTTADCQGVVGAACVSGSCAPSRTCAELRSRAPALADGIYTVDVDGPGIGLPAFAVYCDMTTDGGGWTRVAFEPARSAGDHIQGNLAYLGVEVGGPDAVANASGAGLVGVRFNGHYGELAVTWGADYARMSVTKDVFVNQVDVAMPVGRFVTSNATLAGWVSAAGGAVVCRASRSPDVRPGDTSWALKPLDSVGSGCGCDGATWHDRGAFYGGVLMATSCSSWGGGWAGVRVDGQNKAGLASTTDLALWVR
ncbi:MAG: hypothetical protein M3O50_20630 [Myxococcota bacterium]|nr:hypothetical protein [Myxococcota bacterium]